MKDQEKIFFQYAIWKFKYESFWETPSVGGREYNMRDVVWEANVIFGIPVRHLWFWLEKWTTLGFYNYRTTLDLGWFEFSRLDGDYLELYNAAVDRLKEKPMKYE